VIERLWTALANREPLILAVDDLHWCDPSSLGMIERLLALTERVPLGVMFTLRADATGPAQELFQRVARDFPHRCTELRLGPLSAEASAHVVQRVLGGGDLAPGVGRLVYERADGNPLYLEEVARGLVESGALARGEQGWVLAAGGEPAVPPTLQATLLARLDRLSEPTRHFLQDASVVGRQFALPVAAAVLAADHAGGAAIDVEAALLEAQRAGLLEAVADPHLRRYQFRHVLMQEAAYGTLLLSRRRLLHGLVARVLREQTSEPADLPVEALAEHHALAGQWAEAQAAATAAAGRAEQAFAYREAAARWEAAWRAATARGAAVPPAERAALAEAHGDTLMALGEWDAARAAIQAALAAWMEEPPAVRREARARLHVALARLALRQVDLAAAGEALSAALPALDPGQPLLSRALALEAQVCLQSGHLDGAVAAARRALALALKLGGPLEQAEAYEALAHPSLVGVLGPKACEYTLRWVELARALGDPSRLFAALVGRAIVQFVVAGAATAAIQADAEEALTIARELRAPVLARTARGVLGVVLFLRGNWEAAAREMASGLEAGAEASPYGAFVRFWLGLLHTYRGELAVGRGWFEEGLARAHVAHAPV
jgi:predicted ATPase